LNVCHNFINAGDTGKIRGNTMIHTLLVFALAIPPGLALGAYLAKKIVSL